MVTLKKFNSVILDNNKLRSLTGGKIPTCIGSILKQTVDSADDKGCTTFIATGDTKCDTKGCNLAENFDYEI